MTLPKLAVANSGLGGRGYKHPLRPDLGIVPSVTTVLKAAAKPAIVQWAVDQTSAYAVANAHELLTRSDPQAYNMLRWYHNRSPKLIEEGFDLRNYHEGVLNDAAELGTAMHEWIQADVVGTIPYPDVSHQSDLFWQMVEVWNKYRAEHDIIPHFTESTVWNVEEGYAGTFDGVWQIDGVMTLLDIKTSRSLWPDHEMQIAALLEADDMLMEVGEEYMSVTGWRGVVKQVGFLHVRPDDVTTKGEFLPAYCEYQPAKDLDLRYQQFLGLLSYKKAERAITVREKEMSKSTKS